MAEFDNEVSVGYRCTECGEWIGAGPGIPRLCPECDLDAEPPAERPKGNGRHRKRPVGIKHLTNGGKL